MSQRECAGFNAPRFSVCAGEPVGGGPEAFAASAGKAPPAWFGPPLLPSVALGVFQPASKATLAKSPPPLSVLPNSCLRFPLSAPPVGVLGVGHPEQSLSDMRRADARSAQIEGPHGVSHVFQVSAYSGEPNAAILARNLFSKDRWRK